MTQRLGTGRRADKAGEAVLLGNVAHRSGSTLEWDTTTLRIANAPAAEKFLHYEYRKGWEL